MTSKEISELRRRFNPEKTTIGAVNGCYVNEKGEIVSRFSESVPLMSMADKEKLLALLKRSLSGSIGKQLCDITFSTDQVRDSDEHRTLMSLVRSGLKDESALEDIYQKIASSVTLEESYMILLCHDKYDVPYKNQNGETDGESECIHTYITCSICPVKQTKPGLSYKMYDAKFESSPADTVLSPPVLGFTFPAFDDRATNIYNALYYSKNTSVSNEEFITNIFNTEPPVPPDTQRAVFGDLLTENLNEECNYDTVVAVRECIAEYIETQKEQEPDQNPTLDRFALQNILTESGVCAENTESLLADVEERFGKSATFSPENLLPKKVEITTPDVKITVAPSCEDAVKTEVINGTPYIMIRVSGTVEMNGVELKIT